MGVSISFKLFLDVGKQSVFTGIDCEMKILFVMAISNFVMKPLLKETLYPRVTLL